MALSVIPAVRSVIMKLNHQVGGAKTHVCYVYICYIYNVIYLYNIIFFILYICTYIMGVSANRMPQFLMVYGHFVNTYTPNF